jgi:type II secretory pathway pseudopilin PulG
MKSHFYAALVTGLLALPTVSFAQDASVSVTRADVQADLIRLEQAGYRPSKLNYPTDIQTAEAHLNAQGVTASSNTDVGGVSDGSSQVSAPTTIVGAHSIYSHH